jgi:uncharacterized protein (DUF58 family)
VGNWAGSGSGSSLEFQDHRPYLPGDDPRHIDWAATARGNQAVMKVYHEEVSPRIDLLLDTSASMGVTPEKRQQTLATFLFCVESALSLSASLTVFRCYPDGVEKLPSSRVLQTDWDLPQEPGDGRGVDPAVIPLRPGSLRVVVSDLLTPEDPDAILRPLVRDRGRAVILVPYDAGEAAPDWSGNMELVNCESGAVKRQRISRDLMEHYRQAYRRHMDSWRSRSRALGIGFARVPSGVPLATAFQEEALPAGIVEPWT